MKNKFTNHLINETSAYLLQHAHNPVNWYAWGNEALQKAKEDDKPILVSIGYAACHWCHVMERESFENEETAALMNEHFINIKIDREERPDLDHIYMDAVQAITGSGGWPLNVFLTPDLKPFYGGTYFPPTQAFNRSSWTQVITAVSNAYQTKKEEITQQAENLTTHLLSVNDFGAGLNQADKILNENLLQSIAENLLKTADKEWGGLGNAPKFPQTFSLLYLTRHHYLTGDEAALNQVIISLDKMMKGGIYDHVGGGFSRYSTDRHWQIPHFEKMLYDNALLIDVFTEAFQLTKKNEYANVVAETIQFIKNEMTSAEGGFYSALDADSEGIEGKYYTWSKVEIDALLGKDSEIFCSVFNVTEAGNWEHTNILWMPDDIELTIKKYNINREALLQLIKRSKQILFNERQKRIRPLLDDKILLGWNALMIKSLCKAYAAFENKQFLEMAENCMAFIEKYLKVEDGIYHHNWNKKLHQQPAFLDDYASLIQAYIYLSQVTANNQYLIVAKEISEKVIKDFSDEQGIHFYFTSVYQTDILLRKKEIYDGATPSGNALMAENLLFLSNYFDINDWKQRYIKMIEGIASMAQKYPSSFGYWCLGLQGFITGIKEIAVTGNNHLNILKNILKEYIPLKVIQASDEKINGWPLLEGKNFSSETYIYLCENYQCSNPVKNVEEFKKMVTKTFLTKKPTKQNN